MERRSKKRPDDLPTARTHPLQGRYSEAVDDLHNEPNLHL